MAWCWAGDKLLPETITIQFSDPLCLSRPNQVGIDMTEYMCIYEFENMDIDSIKKQWQDEGDRWPMAADS